MVISFQFSVSSYRFQTGNSKLVTGKFYGVSMRPVELKWDWRDIPTAAAWGLSFRKMLLHAQGALLSYLVIVVLFYAGCLGSGMLFEQVWWQYGISVIAMLSRRPFPSYVIEFSVIVGLIASALIFLHYSTAVSKLV